MSKLRILYDHSVFSQQRRGGITRVICELARRVFARSDQYDARLFAGLQRNEGIKALKKEFPERVVSLRVPRILAKQRLLMPANRPCFMAFSEKFQPHICHYSFYNSYPLASPCKIVITIHDLIHEIFPESVSRQDQQVPLRRQALEIADGIVCVSENTKRDLLRFYDVNDKPIVVAPNGNSLADVIPCRPNAPPPPFCLYVGDRSAWYKNFEIVLHTFAKDSALREIHLILFGGRPLTSKEQRRIQSLSMQDRVHWQSGSDAELAALYASAIALIYPSRYEGFGLPMVEAMSQNCPVIAARTPPLIDVAGEAALYFDPDSEDELAHCILTILRDRMVRQEKILQGVTQARRYSWDSSARKVMDFYRTIV